MKREPSLHITKSKLLEILDDLSSEQRHGVTYTTDMMVAKIFHRAKPYSLSTRTVTVSNQRLERKATKLLNSSRSDADLFAQLVYAIRKKRKHRGISQIKPGSKDWEILKSVTASALDFCNEFEITRREGFIQYIEIGLTKMPKFNLPRFVNLYESICEIYNASEEILKDDDPVNTKLLYDCYTSYIADQTGILDRMENTPEKYVWFSRARKLANELNVPIEVFVKAQFEALDFAKGIPHPTQLVGEKAIERVNRYTFKRKVNNYKSDDGIRRSNLKGIFNQ